MHVNTKITLPTPGKGIFGNTFDKMAEDSLYSREIKIFTLSSSSIYVGCEYSEAQSLQFYERLSGREAAFSLMPL